MLSYVVAGVLLALPEPAQPAEPAPTGVTLAWEAGTPPSRFSVTWQEPAGRRNRVELVTAGGGPTGREDVIVEADRPDHASFPAESSVGDRRVRITAIDAAGAPLSEPALSPIFDTDPPLPPVLHTVIPRMDGTVLMRWRPAMQLDDTPNDPLDRPAGDPPQYIPFASVFTIREWDDLSPPITGTTFVVPPRRMPQVLGVRTVPNERDWTTVEIAGSRLTANVPRTATNGRPLRVDGRAFEVRRACDLGPCFTIERPEADRVLQLQSRTSRSAGWRPVATTRSRNDGVFRFSITSPGSREYRVVAPIVTRPAAETPRWFFATAPATTTSRPPAQDPPADSPPADDPGDDDGMGGSLPVSGSPVTGVAGTGGLFVTLGVLLCWIARRRPS